MDIIQKAWDEALAATERIGEKIGLVGYGVVELFDERGGLVLARPFTNLVTDAGDQYAAKKIIVGTGPAAPSAPTVANGMKLGTGSTAASKASTGAALGAYISGSNVAFDSGYAQSEDLGSGNGYNSVFKTTWGAGVATNSAITEAVIVNDQASNATSSAANTYSRTVFGSVNKGAADTLSITWKWKSLGA